MYAENGVGKLVSCNVSNVAIERRDSGFLLDAQAGA